MYKEKPEFDIILNILDSAREYRPDSVFIQSLLQQYLERGSLSKKQLQGLHSKASKINEIHSSKLATLEATIIKMPTRFKSELPETKPLYTKDETPGPLIEVILAKYPQHKRVLFFKSKFDNNEILSATEIAELKKFGKLLT
ncbi:hypothetical protein BH10BAC2_BH10BAC2_45960 [soil metagenome]